jgi:hypothetical protein
MIQVGITASPRPVDYLPATVASLRAAGWPDPVVFAEPGTPAPPDCRFVAAQRRLEPWFAFQTALGSLLATGPQGASLAIFQDDVLAARNLRAWLDAEPWPPDAGVVSLYLSEAQAEGRPLGWSALDPDANPYGACGVVMRPEVARRLLDDPPHRGNGRMTDTWLGVFCEQAGLRFWQHKPSLIRHVGRESSLSRKGHRPIVRPWIPARHEGDFVEDAALLAHGRITV